MSAAFPSNAQSKPSPVSPISGAATGSAGVLLRTEAFVELVLAVALYRHLGGTWLMFALLFVVPDLSMMGYLVNPRIGAHLYNSVHTYIAPALLALAGVILAIPLLYLLALPWVAHIAFDRVLGAGLKYPTAFGETHLSSKRPGGPVAET